MGYSAGSVVVQRCLVTGAQGFIGSSLTRRLLGQGDDVRALQRRGQPIAGADCHFVELGSRMWEPDSLVENRDIVFHLASTAHTRADEGCYQRDCDVAMALANAAARAGVRCFVYLSSTRAVAHGFASLAVDEQHDDWPVDPYGYWKRETERRLCEYSAIPHLVILRPSLVYGVGMKGNLAMMLRAVKSGWLPPPPPSAAPRSMVWVEDLVSAMLMLSSIASANRKPMFVADNEHYTAATLYAAIRHCYGKTRARWYLPAFFWYLAGRLGDLSEVFWSDCPLSSVQIDRLLGPALFSSTALRSFGWESTTTFYRELPSLLAAVDAGEAR